MDGYLQIHRRSCRNPTRRSNQAPHGEKRRARYRAAKKFRKKNRGSETELSIPQPRAAIPAL
jgi:hypothetical protein